MPNPDNGDQRYEIHHSKNVDDSLRRLQLQVRTIVIAPLVIDFAVSEDHPHVYIKSGRLLSR